MSASKEEARKILEQLSDNISSETCGALTTTVGLTFEPDKSIKG